LGPAGRHKRGARGPSNKRIYYIILRKCTSHVARPREVRADFRSESESSPAFIPPVYFSRPLSFLRLSARDGSPSWHEKANSCVPSDARLAANDPSSPPAPCRRRPAGVRCLFTTELLFLLLLFFLLLPLPLLLPPYHTSLPLVPEI